jgi:hypothetical protein
MGGHVARKEKLELRVGFCKKKLKDRYYLEGMGVDVKMNLE